MVFSKSSTEDALVMGGGQSKLRGFWIMRVSKVSPKDQQKEQYAMRCHRLIYIICRSIIDILTT